MNPKQRLTIYLLGEGNAGKTALIARLRTGQHEAYQASTAFTHNGTDVHITVVDVQNFPGFADFPKVDPQTVAKLPEIPTFPPNAIMWMYNPADPASFTRLEASCNEIRAALGVPMAFLGNERRGLPSTLLPASLARPEDRNTIVDVTAASLDNVWQPFRDLATDMVTLKALKERA